MKNIIIAGNWKMNTSPKEANELFTNIDNYLATNNFQLNKNVISDNLEFVVCPPFVYLQSLQNLKNDNKSLIKIGAQNLYFETKGAFTGEISPLMLKEIGTEYVIIGHSERRTYFSDTDELIAKKIKSALENDLIPIFCIGETLEERQSDKTNEILKNQLEKGLQEVLNLDLSLISKIVIAYEPVWAIGTGLAATNDQVDETHTFIKSEIERILNLDLPILYGGSLNENNAKELLQLKNVNGGLIGGASLKSSSFTKIIEIASEILNDLR